MRDKLDRPDSSKPGSTVSQFWEPFLKRGPQMNRSSNLRLVLMLPCAGLLPLAPSFLSCLAEENLRPERNLSECLHLKGLRDRPALIIGFQLKSS